jgi:hypothetical protein
MSTKITPETLIEMGFVEWRDRLIFDKDRAYITFYNSDRCLTCNGKITNATTIEDIKDLIRLFK